MANWTPFLRTIAIETGIYGITMYLMSIPFVLWRRERN